MNRTSAMAIAAGVVMALMAGVVGVSRQGSTAAVKPSVVVVRTIAAAAPPAPAAMREEVEG